MKTDLVKEKNTETANTVKWTVDKEHSEITFRVKHMMITNVTGLLTDYEIEADAGTDFSNLMVKFSSKTKSITTGNEKRDEHLRSPEFFDAEKNEEITFISTNYSREGRTIKLTGDCTIGGVTKPLTLDVEYHGLQRDPWGNIKAGFSVKGTIQRKDFGLTWNAALEGGGVLVSDEVKISCEIQMIQFKIPDVPISGGIR